MRAPHSQQEKRIGMGGDTVALVVEDGEPITPLANPVEEAPEIVAERQDFIHFAGKQSISEPLAAKYWWLLVNEFVERKGQVEVAGKLPFPVRFLCHPPEDQPWGEQRIGGLVVRSLGHYVALIDEQAQGQQGYQATLFYRHALPRNVHRKTVEFWRQFVVAKLREAAMQTADGEMLQ